MLIQFTGRELLAFGRKIEATCEVRNEVNRERKDNQVVVTRGQTTPHGLPYMPRRFPPGTWEITRHVECGAESEFWPVFLDTNAWQSVRVWTLDKAGHYDKATYQWIRGKGYGIHHARWNPGDGLIPSRTTLGCINIIDPDNARWLGDEVHEAFGLRQRLFISVPPWSEWKT